MFARFLSAVTGIDKELLMKAEYTGGELLKSNLTERGKIADIIVKVASSKQIIVEMNKYDPGYIFEKNASYAFSLFNESTKIGKRMWPQIILINIDNFNRFKTDRPILDFKIREKHENYEVDIFHAYNIVLENFKNPNYNINKDINQKISMSNLAIVKNYFNYLDNKLNKGNDEEIVDKDDKASGVTSSEN